MTTLRPWNQNDLYPILAIEEAVHVAPWNKDAFLMCLQAGYAGYVALNNAPHKAQREIIGFLVMSTHAEECHILNIGVAMAYQRQGIGKMLLMHALKEASDQYHAKVAYLEVRRSNTRAINLYKQFDFEQVGERKQYYQGPHGAEDALVFAKLLRSQQ